MAISTHWRFISQSGSDSECHCQFQQPLQPPIHEPAVKVGLSSTGSDGAWG